MDTPSEPASGDGARCDSPRANLSGETQTLSINGKTLKYPHETTGFLGALNEKQILNFKLLQEKVNAERIDLRLLNKYTLHDDLTLLRFLRATKFSPDNALKQILANRDWQDEMIINQIRESTPDDLLKCSVSLLHKIYPHWCFGYDLKGRPVIYQQYAFFSAAKVLAETNLNGIARYTAWEKENHMYLCKKSSLLRGEIIETTTTVLDLDGMSISQVTSDFLTIIRMVADIGKTQYPETLGKLFIINTPSAFPYVWGIIRGFLDPAVASKVELLSTREKWVPVLQETIGVENLPENYGGKKASLTIERHPYSEVMIDFGWDKDYEGEYDLYKSDEYADKSASTKIRGGEYSVGIKYNNSFSSIPETTDDHSDDSDYQFSDAYDSIEDVSAHGGKGRSFPPLKFKGDNLMAISEHPIQQFPQDLIEKHISSFNYISGVSCWQSSSFESIRIYLMYAMAFYFLANLGALISATILLSQGDWVSVGDLQMWTVILLFFLSCLIVGLTVAGYYGIKQENKEMTEVIAACFNISGIVFLVIGSVTANYSQIKKFEIAYAAFAFLLAIMSYVPSSLAHALAERMDSSQFAKVSVQNSWIIKILSIISIVIAIAMLIFGGQSLKLINSDNISYYFFPLYGLIYGAISIILVSLQGLWVSSTVHRSVVAFHYLVLTPLLVAILFLAGCLSLRFSNDDTTISITCLFSGILLLLTCAFQILSLIVVRRRNALMLDIRYAERVSGLDLYFGLGFLSESGKAGKNKFGAGFAGKAHMVIERSNIERFLITYGILTGVFDIFFCMTYLIFELVIRVGTETWLSSLFNYLGKADARYLESDSFLVSVHVLHLLFIGPGLLAYSWSTFVRATWRHVLGEIISVVLINSQFIYLMIELNENSYNWSLSGEVALILIPQVSFYMIVPAIILFREVRASINASNRSESVDLFVQAKELLLKDAPLDSPRINNKNKQQLKSISSPKKWEKKEEDDNIPSVIFADMKKAQHAKLRSESEDGVLGRQKQELLTNSVQISGHHKQGFAQRRDNRIRTKSDQYYQKTPPRTKSSHFDEEIVRSDPQRKELVGGHGVVDVDSIEEATRFLKILAELEDSDKMQI